MGAGWVGGCWDSLFPLSPQAAFFWPQSPLGVPPLDLLPPLGSRFLILSPHCRSWLISEGYAAPGRHSPDWSGVLSAAGQNRQI